MLTRSGGSLDWLGTCASFGCMIHCLAFPMFAAVLPLLSGTETSAHTSAGAAAIAQPVEDDDCCREGCCTPEPESTSACEDACCASPAGFWTHVGMLTAVAPIGLVAWISGYRRHRRSGVLLLGISGLGFLLAALSIGPQLFGGRGELILTVCGSIAMVTAHQWNRRQCRCTDCNGDAEPAQPTVTTIATHNFSAPT
jgi:hypothetical protein